MLGFTSSLFLPFLRHLHPAGSSKLYSKSKTISTYKVYFIQSPKGQKKKGLEEVMYVCVSKDTDTVDNLQMRKLRQTG